MKRAYNTYFGGKGGQGAYQTIINHIRPHDHFYELFAGNATILSIMKSCEKTTLNDLDKSVFNKLQNHFKRQNNFQITNCDAISLLRSLDLTGGKKTTIYLDPPYPTDAIKGKHQYNYIMTDAEHIELLQMAKSLDCDILISTYPNDLYSNELKDWKLVEFQNTTRQGKATEHLFMNYDCINELHDYSYLGNNHRERQIIKKKVRRWKQNFKTLDILQKRLMIKELESFVS